MWVNENDFLFCRVTTKADVFIAKKTRKNFLLGEINFSSETNTKR